MAKSINAQRCSGLSVLMQSCNTLKKLKRFNPGSKTNKHLQHLKNEFNSFNFLIWIKFTYCTIKNKINVEKS